MDVSLVPAFDALGQLSSSVKPKPQVYATLLESGCQKGEHAACFAELRRNFVNTRPAKLKNLILLVKHWYRQVCPKAGRNQMPPAYALELLTIFAWEQGCGKEAFSLAQGLRTVLGLIQQYQHLCVFWTTNYSCEDPAVKKFLQRQLEGPRPVILDPADPTWDVGDGAAWRWDLLAQEAESCYDRPCFLQAAGGAVQPWEGPDLPRTGRSGVDHPILRDPAQRTPTDGSSVDAGCSRAGDRRPLCPAPGPSVDGIAPCTPEGVPGLSQVPAKELDRFIQDHLKPSPQFQKQVSKAVDGILSCLRENCVHKASRVGKGGAFGRGTDLRGGCDAELVIFLNCFEDYKDQGPRRAEILADMRDQLESWWRDPVPGLTLNFPEQTMTEALRFQLVSPALASWTDVSLLPVFDAVGQLSAGTKPDPQIYRTLLDSGCQDGEHRACFAELRRNFVNSRPAKLKNLILLVKHWYRQVAARNKGEQPARASLPPAYALELLTIFAWEQGCGKDRFNTAEGLRTVLGLVQQHQQLCVFWTVNYSSEDPALRTHLLGQLRKPRPLILDPADPTWNVGLGSWELLAQEAAALETQACFMSADGTPVQPWDVMPTLLYQTPARDLDKFISDFLQPNRQFLAQVNKAVDTICSFLRENCFQNSPIKVLKVVKRGSSAKGTALRGRSDADLVVFLSCFRQFAEQGSTRAEVISEIRAQLEACKRARQFEVKFDIPKWENPRVLSFSLTSQTMLDQSVDCDVLPAFDALGQLAPGSRPPPQVYVDLICSYNTPGEYSSCFTELQRDFVIARPTKLKSLIRLVKHWYRQCKKMPKGKGSLPPQHGLELLTVYAWEQGGQDPQFSMAEGFRTVLELVTQYRQLCVYWTVNYSREDQTVRDFLEQQLRKPRPIILDPADPTGNLGPNARWDLLAKEAQACISSLCCIGRDGTPIQPWPVRPTLLTQPIESPPCIQRALHSNTALPPAAYTLESSLLSVSWLFPASKLSAQRSSSSSASCSAVSCRPGRQPAAAMGNWLSSSCPETVYLVPAQKLDEYIQTSLRPTEDCQRQIDEAVDTICAALQEATEPPMVIDVAKGGSYGRKTVLKGNSDGTLVIFISDLEKFQDQKENQHEILDKIWERLRACQLERKLTVKMEMQRSYVDLTIRLSTQWQSVTFDVLPAFDALDLSGKPSPSTYRDLKRALDQAKASPGGFSVCFTKLQQNFFNNHPRKLKDLTLLVKAWHQQCQKWWEHRSLPPSYALELLTVYAWEEGCREEDFDIVQGLRTVLELIEKQEQLCVYWTVNYNFEDETVRNVMLNQIRSSRPVILDPTDPTNMVSKDETCWRLLKIEAQNWLFSLSLRESPGPSWNVLAASLHETPGHLLDKFIKDFLQPTKTVNIQIKTAVGIISKFLKEICFRHSATKVQKPIKAGSSGKGTALRTGSDADLVVFVDSLTSFPSQKAERYNVIKEIKHQLEAYQRQVTDQEVEVTFEISKWEAPRVLSFSLKSRNLNGSVDFDVLPAFNALEKLGPLCRVYTKLIAQYEQHADTPGGEFSACFTELQRDFVSSRPTKLKDLLRLVKHWYKQCERRLKKKGSLPPKYALELLTIYAWEQGSGATSFDTAQGFRTVLELVTRYQQLCVFWTVNYNFENETVRNFLLKQLQRPRPVILDPADPTGDVGGGNRWCWHRLANEAAEWLSSSLCFKDGTGGPVPSWKVPTVQTPGSCGAGVGPVINEMFSYRSRGILD
ncbi:PREDICTED: 2'-5'-oligoadenylate synthase 3 [Myotis brandtii]|uniref:2'-5'-oligoadenylate synthase 3 n=1 Tax=Myotis brandtii TaxID=109478 RepID=UPI0007040C26|nr:PREDICTED: 2'-5'-oligoadenylate synthase 3 [Myotis brandtii]